jgi:hypothetical protein
VTWERGSCQTGPMNARRPFRPSRRLAAARVPALLLVLATAMSACGSPAPSQTASSGPVSTPHGSAAAGDASPNVSDAATYLQIEQQVEQLRGLSVTKTVDPTLLDEKGVQDWLAKENQAQTDHAAMAKESRLLIHLGLLPPGSSLEQLELDLQEGQVIGFYDPDTKQLYILSQSGGVGVLQKVTFSHEFTHALQDQNFGLAKLATDAPDQSDRDLGRLSLAEGDATLLMSQWTAKNLSLIEMLGLAGSAGTGADQMAAAPAILRETLLFPYQQGLAFVQGIYDSGGWDAVDKLYSKPPDSSSQILHPALYAAGIEPVTVSLPKVPASLAAGWQLVSQDTLGELDLGVWLEGEHPTSAQTDAATSATTQWGGDRVGLYEGPSGAWAVVLRTVWRTDAGSLAFRDEAALAAGRLPGSIAVCSGSGTVDVYVASDRATLDAFSACNPIG